MPRYSPDDEDFDLRTRVELGLAYDPQGVPDNLFRHTPWILRRGVRRFLAVTLLVGLGIGTMLAIRPPELVRGAIEHEFYERTLHGTFMEAQPLLQHLGLGQSKLVPGFPQLMRPCDIDGHLVYHLTTFFEKGGMVTVFSFDQPVALKEGSGWWDNVYWQVVTSKDDKPLVLVAQKKQALAVARASFAKRPS
jgi:hypothetical protein